MLHYFLNIVFLLSLLCLGIGFLTFFKDIHQGIFFIIIGVCFFMSSLNLEQIVGETDFIINCKTYIKNILNTVYLDGNLGNLVYSAIFFLIGLSALAVFFI